MIFCIFCLELVLNSLARPDYFLGFFFCLDLLAVFSLLPDIPWIWQPMIGLKASDAIQPPRDLQRMIRITDSRESLRRVVRFIRLIRLVRIAKLFELCQRKLELLSKRRLVDRDVDPLDSDELTKPSQVGQHLSEQTTRKVVLLVLVMLFGIPILQPQIQDHAERYTITELNYMASSNLTLGIYTGPVFESTSGTEQPVLTPEAQLAVNATMASEIAWVIDYYHDTCLYLRIKGTYASFEYTHSDLDSYRTSEVKGVSEGDSIGLFSRRGEAQLAGEYAFITTFVVLALLTIGAILFNGNNHRMVIVPIERMMATIVALQANPLAKASLSTMDNDRLGSSQDHNNETGMLERTLEKLTGLLQVGFGEAGSKMIQKCMNLNAEGDLDPLVDGTKMLALFGFCDIRRFTDATECLKEDVMLYVNEIAAIVHSNVTICDGNPNKNIGDAFLLVWRLPGDHMDGDDLFHMNDVAQPRVMRPTLETVRQRKSLDLTPTEKEYAQELERKELYDSLLDRAKKAGASCPPILRPISPNVLTQVAIIADKAIVSFLRIIVEIAASDEVRRYANHPRIQASFGTEFEVTLGFGLHCGWAIEGPIGSRYKIDASYLSPHVNLSETLQDATKVYGTPLLMSGEFYSLLSPYLKAHCRRLDVVRVSGREAPMNLYGFDIHPSALASIIAERAPVGYDDENDAIQVVELRGRNTILDELGSDRNPAAANSPHAQYEHELFRNPYLNAHETDFTIYDFRQPEREAIHAAGPIASYHLVRNFRLSALQCGIPQPFFDIYAAGLDQYLDGDWSAAHHTLKRAADLYPHDQATKVLIETMKEHHFIAPPTWTGCHEI